MKYQGVFRAPHTMLVVLAMQCNNQHSSSRTGCYSQSFRHLRQ